MNFLSTAGILLIGCCIYFLYLAFSQKEKYFLLWDKDEDVLLCAFFSTGVLFIVLLIVNLGLSLATCDYTMYDKDFNLKPTPIEQVKENER